MILRLEIRWVFVCKLASYTVTFASPSSFGSGANFVVGEKIDESQNDDRFHVCAKKFTIEHHKHGNYSLNDRHSLENEEL
jgi:hypothetical protein